MTEILNNLTNAMRDLDEPQVLALTEQLVAADCAALMIQTALNNGIKEVGARFESGEYFLADLIVSGVIYQNAMKSFNATAALSDSKIRGKVVIGVPENDIHDIGKAIIIEVLRAEGFEVIDLGVDVKPQRFVEAVIEHKPDILALSGVMGFALDSMDKTIKALEQHGLRNNLHIVVGGNCILCGNPELLHADKLSTDPIETVSFCKEVTENSKTENANE